MGIHLIVDSCCDHTPELKKTLGLDVAPLKIQTAEGRQYVDNGEMDIRELLADMKASKLPPTSACPSPEEYARYMRQYDECLVITLSSKLSGSYNTARNAMEMVREEFPEKRIYIFDSKSASAGELRIALYVKELIDAGKNFDTIVLMTERLISEMRTLFVLEDLSNLVKNGRLNKVSGILASVLSLCPILGDDGKGEIKMVSKARGNKMALNKLVELVKEYTASVAPRSLLMVLAYCNCPARAEGLKKALLEHCAAFREIVTVPTGGLSTMYASNGGIVLAY